MGLFKINKYFGWFPVNKENIKEFEDAGFYLKYENNDRGDIVKAWTTAECGRTVLEGIGSGIINLNKKLVNVDEDIKIIKENVDNLKRCIDNLKDFETTTINNLRDNINGINKNITSFLEQQKQQLTFKKDEYVNELEKLNSEITGELKETGDNLKEELEGIKKDIEEEVKTSFINSIEDRIKVFTLELFKRKNVELYEILKARYGKKEEQQETIEKSEEKAVEKQKKQL